MVNVNPVPRILFGILFELSKLSPEFGTGAGGFGLCV
jgi:hypothetical protein